MSMQVDSYVSNTRVHIIKASDVRVIIGSVRHAGRRLQCSVDPVDH
jgi:hypothetical protein